EWEVQYRRDVPDGQWVSVIVKGSSRSVSLKSLASSTTYTWQVRARCQGEWQPFSSTASFTTTSGGKPRAASISNEPTLDIRVSNNPATSHTSFRLQVISNNAERVNLRIVDITGRAVESFQSVAPGSTIETGSGWIKGLYLLEAMQGSRRVTVKLLKQ
ncbi:MAG: T9SS type A sorting domain-containing protein, partial [Chitinophagaceae bacterium]|nr:T9SS type A sorting domain-containing protein [Chitinophagaceae bacterium]